MIVPNPLPRAVAPFVDFATLLRRNSFAVAPDQTAGFIEAVGILGPHHMDDIRRAAHAMFAPQPEQRAEFDALFRSHFYGQSVAGSANSADDDDDMVVLDQRDGEVEPPDADEINEVGAESTAAEALSIRAFDGLSEDEALNRFSREAPSRLARRHSNRRMPAKSGPYWNMRRSLREAVRYDGEVMSIPKLRRRTRPRRLLLLIDVSGSMKEQTQSALRFAHTLMQATRPVEVFTFGTKLTRVTRALDHRNRSQALDLASTLVSDWDGGTRIGDALEAFLSVPRFVGFTRGAAVIILSDGLEWAEPDAMIRAVTRMARMAWRIDWLTPLAGDPAFRPETRALRAVAPIVSAIGDGSRTQSLCAHVLNLAVMS